MGCLKNTQIVYSNKLIRCTKNQDFDDPYKNLWVNQQLVR